MISLNVGMYEHENLCDVIAIIMGEIIGIVFYILVRSLLLYRYLFLKCFKIKKMIERNNGKTKGRDKRTLREKNWDER